MKRLLVVSLVLLFAVPVFAQATYRATLSWVDNSTNETGFRIERSMNLEPRSWNPVGTVGPNIVSFVDEPILGGDDFCWRVVATGSAGDSLPSPEACAAAPTIPAAPGGLQVIISIAGAGGS